MKLYYILLFTLFTLKSFSQYFNWANDFPSGISYSLKTDKYGNSYITGSFNNTIDLDPTSNTYTLSATNLTNDVFVAKYNTNGSLMFAFSIGSTGDDIGKSIDVDNMGNIIIMGDFFDTVDFNTAVGIDTLCAPSFARDNFIAKYDANGNFLWVNHLTKGNTGSTNDCQKIHIDNNNDVIVTGVLDGGVYFSNGNIFTFLNQATLNNEIYFAKYLSNGSFSWAYGVGGSMYDYAGSIGTDSLNNIYLSGRFESNIDLDPSLNVAQLTNTLSTSADNIFIAKYTPIGTYIWGQKVVSANSTTATPIDYEIAVQRNGNVYITGYLSGSCDFNPSSAIANLSGNADCFFAKYDNNGNYVWANRIGGGTYDDSGMDIEVDTLGNVFLLGNFTGTVDFNPSTGTTNMTSTAFTDLFFGKYNTNGGIVWVRHIGTGTVKSLEIDQQNNIYLYGNHSATGNVDFDPNAGVYNLNGNYATIFLAKYGATIPTGQAEIINADSKLLLFPNPASNEINIICDNTINDSEIIITNVLGQHIISFPISNDNTNYNIEHLKSGIYFVSLINKQSNLISRIKFVKE